jgi:hypothetical protein
VVCAVRRIFSANAVEYCLSEAADESQHKTSGVIPRHCVLRVWEIRAQAVKRETDEDTPHMLAQAEFF